jgi:hypothetical protein
MVAGLRESEIANIRKGDVVNTILMRARLRELTTRIASTARPD